MRIAPLARPHSGFNAGGLPSIGRYIFAAHHDI